jgi:hypothetical protein
MFTDKKRAEVHNEIRRRDQALFDHLLSPDLFFQAAQQCGLRILLCPLNLINLVWLAVAAARQPDRNFADILAVCLKTLQDHQSFSKSAWRQLLAQPKRRRHQSRHDPRKHPAEPVSEAAFAKARQRLPSEFWVALFLLLAEKFQSLYGDVIRWRRFRLLAIDGTGILLPDWPALREQFGTQQFLWQPRSASPAGAAAVPPGTAALRLRPGAVGSGRDKPGPTVTAGAARR